MNVYVGRQTKGGTTPDSNPRYSDKSDKGVEGFGHKLYMDSFFSSPDLFDNLAQKKILVVAL